MFSIHSHPALSRAFSSSAPVLPTLAPEEEAEAVTAVAVAALSQPVLPSEPCALEDSATSAFAARARDPGSPTPPHPLQRPPLAGLPGSPASPAAPATPGATFGGGSSGGGGLHRAWPHLKPQRVDDAWDPILAQGSTGADPELRVMADQFSAMRATSLPRYQSSGPTHLEFPLY